MRPYVFELTPAALIADGLASGNSSAGASVTLDGTLTSGGTFTSADGLAHKIIITDTSALDQSGATYTVTGTDSNGLAQTENIAGPTASGSVTTSSYFLTVTSITIASPVATSTVNIGTVDEVMTKWLPLNYRAHEAATHAVDISGTIDYTVQETIEEIHPQLKAGTPENLSWFALDTLTAKTADLKELGELHTSACRFITNSYTAGATVKWVIFQNED